MSLLGERLRQARKARGMSLAALAAAAGGIVTRQALFKYENALDVPRSSVLLALARALGISVDYFFRASTEFVTLSEPACRKRARLGKRKFAAIQADVTNRIQQWLELEALFPPGRFRSFFVSAEKQKDVRSLEEIETLAKDIRKHMNIGLMPIENLTELLEDNGVKVIAWSGKEKDFDGFACWAKHHVPLIVIKAGLPGDRQRSNLAHELGHLVIKPGKAVDPEKAARRFSGAFLVPDEVVLRELGATRHKLDLPELLTLKKKYGMSVQQWIYRAKDLGIITEGYATKWFRVFRGHGWHINEPGESLREETSSRLKRLALQAVAEDMISPARATELTRIPIIDLREEMRS